MEQTHLRVELMSDPSVLAELSALVLARGELLVCDRCQDADEIIVSILHIPELEGTWSLCGPCMREFPRGATVV